MAWGRLTEQDLASKRTIKDNIALHEPDMSGGQVDNAAGQVWRFASELKAEHVAVMYHLSSRLYHIGDLVGDIQVDVGAEEDDVIYRNVRWDRTKARDDLSLAARNSLGSVLTLFSIDALVAGELDWIPDGDVASPVRQHTIEKALEQNVAQSVGEQALELTKDRLARLKWDEMQEIVAGLLRALGYKTRVSSEGPDRGKDIIASKDGFGFERPRIAVEVKHRKDQMGAQEIRSFLGGRHADDRGLYVSTGGFSREARYEAERASTVTHLMDLDQVARALIEQYDGLDEEARRLLPLQKTYWPV